MTGPIRFILNDAEITLDSAAPGDMLLDFLRLERRLTGTKEGCAEGDCGACTVLVGRPRGGALVYEPINACIRPLVACHATHVVTIEHLRGLEGGLHPVQRAMVDHHASQCGFCTPGIVMALAAWRLNGADSSEGAIETALQGNLCRCTGYAPILRAARASAGVRGDPLLDGAAEMAARLTALEGTRVDISRGAERAIRPVDVDDLAATYLATPQATLIAGASDVGLWVTKQMRPISPAIFIGHLMGASEATRETITLGAGVTFARFVELADAHMPELSGYLRRIGGPQVRAAGTVGGNIANGSPIGDLPPALIALGARLTLRRGADRREIALEDFFVDYGAQDRGAGEFVERVTIPRPREARFSAYKVSKRPDSDISAVAAGFLLRERQGVVVEARFAFGGMAGTPKRARGAEAALIGRPFTREAVEAAAAALADDFTPLSDWRASADYRRLVAANLLRRFWLEAQSGSAPVRLASAGEAGR